jgi:hypothetical protein
MAKKPSSPAAVASGAPRWTYGLGAIVGAAALVWAISSHFSKAHAATPPVVAVPASVAVAVVTPASAPTSTPTGGPPLWVMGLTAIVTAAGLVWTIASHFIPKAEAAKPVAAAPAPAAASVVISPQVSAPGGIAIGVVDRSQLTLGTPPATHQAHPPAAPPL